VSDIFAFPSCRNAGALGRDCALENFASRPHGFPVANLTDLHGEILWQGEILGSPREASLTMNARVEMTPEVLKTLVENALRGVVGSRIVLQNLKLQSFSPGVRSRSIGISLWFKVFFRCFPLLPFPLAGKGGTAFFNRLGPVVVTVFPRFGTVNFEA
jgi:hypothetical protein